jgi:putative ATPase
MDLPFAPNDSSARGTPLADRMRPASLDEFLSQEQIVGPGTLLRRTLERGEINQSMILWGPPGCGKTTLARLIAARVKNRFVPFSAVTSGIADVKGVIRDAKKLRPVDGLPLLLFVDEIHRFNKAQQDAFLPHIEDGTIVFIGATTENPSFEVIGPLLSRSRVFVLEALESSDIERILERALADEARGLGRWRLSAEPGVLAFAAEAAQGDARVALNALEYAASVLRDAEEPRVLTRDPMFIARRLVRFASEDVGNADPQALSVAVAAKEAVAFIGYPECKLALAQCAIYLALAPKSNAVYTAYDAAADAVRSKPPYPVPLVIRNAPTRLMKDLGYGKDYVYPHDHPDAAPQDFLPEELRDTRFYHPKDAGFEAELSARLDAFLARRGRKDS